MARLLNTALIALVSVVIAILYSRAGILYLFYSNAPGRFERVNNLKSFDVKFPNVVRNCEDIILNEDEGFVLLSCNAGRDTWNTVMGIFEDPKAPPETGLYLWQYAGINPWSQPEKLKLLDFNVDAKDFHPLGIEYHSASQTLFVVNHAEQGSRIDIFRLFISEAAATHVRTLEHPLLAAPNSVTALSATRLFVTNDHYFLRRYHPVLAVLETYLGIPGGTVVYVDLDSRAQKDSFAVQVVARVPFANGIVHLNSTTLAIASTSMNSVMLYTVEQIDELQNPRLSRVQTIPVPFHVDNLSVDNSGRLLIAGHPHGPTLEKVARSSARCNTPGQSNEVGCDLRALSWIAEWSEESGLKTLYAGSDFATSTTAVRDIKRKLGFAVGLYERGILTWDE